MMFFKVQLKVKEDGNESVESVNRRSLRRVADSDIMSQTIDFNQRQRKKSFFCLSENRFDSSKVISICDSEEEFRSKLPEFLELLPIAAKDPVFTEEIGIDDFKRELYGADRSGYIPDESRITAEYGLDALRPGAFRDCEFDEFFISETDRDTVSDEIGRTLFAKSLMPEIDRIFDCDIKPDFFGHPCHYMFVADSQNADIKTAREDLLSALYTQKRLKSRRCWHLKLDFASKISSIVLSSLFSLSRGGCVIISYSGTNIENERQFASTDRLIIETICDAIEKNQNDTLAVLCLSDRHPVLRNTFYECLGSVNVYEAGEEPAKGETAIHYLNLLCAEKKVEPDEDLLGLLDENKGYRAAELKTLFSGWYSKKLKTCIFPEYKNLQRAEMIRLSDPDKEKGSAYEKFSSLIGLEEAKQVINNARDYFTAQKIFKDRGFSMKRPSMHMVFTGNPGSCKTTVARLVGEMFRENGILSSGHLVECGRSDLVAQYVGWTAMKVQKKFAEARGGVLFIDEAYSLVDGTRGSFGEEAINTIVQEMENRREDTVVIFAGYPEEMQGFLDTNPGLRSRIAFHVHFNDYNPDELCRISKLIADENGLELSDGALEKLYGVFKRISSSPDFGNGRAARNIIEAAKMAMSTRLLHGDIDSITEKDARTLLAEDIHSPVQPANKVEYRRIGF